MPIPAPSEPAAPTRMTVERYFALVDEGLLEPDDRVELLEGVVARGGPLPGTNGPGSWRAAHAGSSPRCSGRDDDFLPRTTPSEGPRRPSRVATPPRRA